MFLYQLLYLVFVLVSNLICLISHNEIDRLAALHAYSSTGCLGEHTVSTLVLLPEILTTKPNTTTIWLCFRVSDVMSYKLSVLPKHSCTAWMQLDS